MKKHATLTFASASIGAVITLLSHAQAIDFEYIKIAEIGDPILGGNTVSQINDYDLDGTQAVFSGRTQGVYRVSDGVISIVADLTTDMPGNSTTFGTFGHPSISNGEVAFQGTFNSRTGVYATLNGSLTRIVDNTMPIPSGSGNFGSFLFGAGPRAGLPENTGINSGLSAGRIAFGGSGGGTIGIYYSEPDGQLRRIVDSTTAVVAGGSATIEGDEVAFVGGDAGGLNVYRYSVAGQSLTPVIPAGTMFPNGALPNPDSVPLISGDSTVFSVEVTSGHYDGIYLADSTGVHLIADGTTPAPGGGTFVTGATGLGSQGVSLSGGSVAFASNRSIGGAGVYTTLGGSLTEVISTSDTLSGRAIASIISASPKISGGNILFGVSFNDGDRGLYVAMSEHGWDGAAGGGWDTSTNWSFDLAPRGVVPTFLNPAIGTVITGPAAATTLKSLEVGARDSGIAELQLQPTGQVNVVGVATVTPRGRIDVAGVFSAVGGLTNNGIIAATTSGQIIADLNNGVNGNVRVGAGQRLTISGQNSSNAGTIDVTGGELEFTGALANSASAGLITARDATLRFGQLTNSGGLAIVAGTSDIHGDIVNTGAIAVSGGPGDGAQTAIFHDDVVQNGTLTVAATGTTHSVAVFLGGFSGAGGITGGGDVFFEGDLRPGNSPAAVTYGANISLASSASITMELAGHAEGAQYDHLTVTGSFTLGGTLAIQLLDGFSPQAGDEFDLFDFDPALLSGNFASIQFPALGSGLNWDSSGLSDTGIVAVVPEPSTGLLVCFSSFALLARRLRTKMIKAQC
jgi:hypothetical protein